MSEDIPSSQVYATSNMPWAHGPSSEPSPIRQMLDALHEADDETRKDFYESVREYARTRFAPAEERTNVILPYDGPKPDWQAKAGTVYYLRFADRVKIGFSTNLKSRLQAIPHDEVLATEPGTMRQERERHAQFADLRVTGEWFRYEEPLVSHIASLAADSPSAGPEGVVAVETGESVTAT